MRILVTEMAGRASVELKGRELGVDLAGQADAIGRVVDQVKVLEADGWSFEAADASFELLLRAQLPDAPQPLFELESYKTSVEHWGNGVVVSEATVKVHVDGERIISTAEGNGPVNALDNALRQALVGRYPHLAAGRAGRLQGPHPRVEGRHERDHAGADRHHRRGGGVDDGGRPLEHRRGLLARARRRPDLRRPPPRAMTLSASGRHRGQAASSPPERSRLRRACAGPSGPHSARPMPASSSALRGGIEAASGSRQNSLPSGSAQHVPALSPVCPTSAPRGAQRRAGARARRPGRGRWR